MIKLSILMVRKAGMSYEDFAEHWGTIHAETVAAQPSHKKYIRRYIRNHRTPDVLPGAMQSGLDGIAEIWYDSIEDVKAFFPSPHYRNNVIHDEMTFMDRQKCELIFTTDLKVIS
ncbi:hypothetical protein DLJ53_32560 [Acuticoccus sediminis]|uniref:EthD domain-containing protein n=1 Tax=Acuticoccus sediminis TaxID=2184697 RepID=A0A8B2NGX9_9HYPH|nr:EthD domain-containing protein [Acuticoccus sediminis]RAH96383.1 hypothetical protein DLJ53_32560 [Acuticoccus sediminis]